MSGRPIALSIAGSDSSGGAGIQADLKTFSALGVYGASVLTAITAQNTMGVQGVEMLPATFVGRQIDSVFDDLDVGAVKTGMLGSAAIIAEVAGRLEACGVPCVIDPVMVATSGDLLIERAAVAVLQEKLLPVATLVTPNIDEAGALLGVKRAATIDELVAQGEALRRAGCAAVLMKGGHFEGERADDVLVTDGGAVVIEGRRIPTSNTHGTGCTLASAIAAHLAAGFPLESAVRAAKAFLSAALAEADTLDVGRGNGPVDHLFQIKPLRFGS
ncbi:MAG: bifunctional hydroxymethylpyrimidine kinase/phosphomethylpyrimidine kinase [Alphaproteobacteria bacterium]|nr:bifunctional hydroxymethylpyrimidine kinase/phosphomethylpyrimidine kinase [Alphaproteobacteria bacterium]